MTKTWTQFLEKCHCVICRNQHFIQPFSIPSQLFIGLIWIFPTTTQDLQCRFTRDRFTQTHIQGCFTISTPSAALLLVGALHVSRQSAVGWRTRRTVQWGGQSASEWVSVLLIDSWQRPVCSSWKWGYIDKLNIELKYLHIKMSTFQYSFLSIIVYYEKKNHFMNKMTSNHTMLCSVCWMDQHFIILEVH